MGGGTLLLLLSRGSAPGLAADALEAAIAFLAAQPGLAGVHSDEAPPETPLPYLVLIEPEADTTNESGGASIESVRWQLSCFAEGKAAARALRRLAAGLLNDATFPFEGGALLHCRSADRASLKDPDRGPGGCDVWQEIQFFDVVVGRG